MSGEERLRSLIPVTEDDELLIKLRKDVLYICLMDATSSDSNKIRAKVIDVNATKAYKPTNDTAAVLLYFLSRENNDPVLLSDFLSIFASFEKEDEIKDFLLEIDGKYILDVKKVPRGTQGANKDALDPVNLLGNLTTWQTPSITADTNPPVCRTSTYFSAGSIAFNVKR